MASSEYGSPDDSESPLADANVYKATTNSDYVVVRRVRLFRFKFITYHNIDENEDDNKQWILTSQCELQPRTAAEIREPSTKYVRPRGQWAITTLVKPKSGTRDHSVRLFMFTLSWPTRWAAKGYTSFSFGFEDLEEARHWHTRLAERMLNMRAEKAAAAAAAGSNTPSSTPHAGGGGGGGGFGVGGGSLQRRLSVSNGGGGAGGGFVRISTTAAAAEGGAAVRGGIVLVKMSSIGRKHGASGDGRLLGSASETSQQPQVASPNSASASVEGGLRRASTSGAAAKRALVYDGPGNGAAADGAPASAPVSGATGRSSSFAAASAAAAAAVALAAPPPKAAAPPPLPPPPPSSSDSEGPYEDLDDVPSGLLNHHHHHHRGSGVSLVGPASCRQPRGTARGDVRHTKQRWVPYKQVNGVAIYHRPQTAGDAEAGVGGEFMVSTVVRGSPRRCLTALTSHCGNTTILGPALVQEVLQRRQAVDEKEVLRIVVQAPGLTGVICAPRELVVETVFKTDETGPTLVLMFNSCEVPARFVERKPGQQPTPAQQQQNQLNQRQLSYHPSQLVGASPDEAESSAAASEGGRRSWWRRPVAARVRGGYTMAPLEEYSLDNSPEALVTCIMKVDLGGVCGERSWLRLASDLVGWTDAFLDRMLMAVTLLRDEVEQGRFVVQPLSMMASSSRAKERDREAGGSGSAADLPPLGLGLGGGAGGLRSVESNLAAAAAAAAGGGGGGGAGGRRSGRLSSTAACGAVPKRRSRKEVNRSSLVDGAAADSADGAPPTVSAAAAAASAKGDVSLLEEAREGLGVASAVSAVAEEEQQQDEEEEEEGSLASPGVGPSVRHYDTMEEVLARMRSLSLLDSSVWDNLHQPGKDAPFKIRGPTYLKDRKKIPAGYSRFVLGSMDVIRQPQGAMHEHVARFIPAIRQSGAPFSVVVHLVIPGTPLLGIVATFVSDRHPSALGQPPASPMEDDHDWEPFDFVLHKYMNGSTFVRNHMLKLIPHIADGSWAIKQSVGTTPVILGKQLRTIYYETPQYIEIDIDISANNVASYVTGLVRGATRSLVIDMGFVLEGTTPWELPEALLGTLRLYHLDIRDAKLMDVSREIPLRPPNMAPPPQTLKHTGAGLPAPPPPHPGHYAGEPLSPAAAPAAAAAAPSAQLNRVSGGGGGAAAAVAQSGGSVSGRLTPVGGGGVGGGLVRRGSGLPTGGDGGAGGSPVSDLSSPSPSSGGGGGSRPASAAQTPLAAATPPLRPLAAVSNSVFATAAATAAAVCGCGAASEEAGVLRS